MSEPMAYVSGRVCWAGELKKTRNDKPMRNVLIAPGQDTPAVSVLLFGDEAERVNVGDSLAVEGPAEAKVWQKNGEDPKPSLSVLARWSKLTGRAGARQCRDQRRDDRQHGQGNGAQHHHHGPAGLAGPEPPYNDEFPI
ncbi:MAG: hypothetical protein AAGA21_16370 [Pseudomonadota bacterium]